MSRNRSIRNLAVGVLTATALALALLAGCMTPAGKGKAEQGKEVQVPTTYRILDHKGAATGNNNLPQWLSVYLDSGSMVTAVEKLPAFKGKYCFIGYAESQNKLFAQRWATSVDAPSAIATQIHARIEGVVKADEELSDTDKDRATDLSQATNFAATVSGARPTADWWIQLRRYDPDNAELVLGEDYRAYALYTFDKDSFNRQLAAAMQRDIDAQDKLSIEERRIYTDLIQRIIRQGLDVEPADSSASPISALSGSLLPGTYTFSPRPRAVRGVTDVNAYLNQIVVHDGYVAVYLTGTPAGKSGYPEGFPDSHAVVMRDLDMPSRVYEPVYYSYDSFNPSWTFASADTRRFSLASRADPPVIFKEIAVGAPDA